MKKKYVQHIVTSLITLISVFLIFLTDYSRTLKLVFILTLVSLLFVYFLFVILKKEMFSKLLITAIFLGAIVSVVVFVLYKVDFFDHVKDEESLKEYIASFGNFAVVIFFIIQFMQVLLAPIPGTVTIAAGALLFEPILAAVVSMTAIISASMVAFLIGRVFGVKVVKWIVGEEALKKGLQMVKGKDKIALTLMFIFPFFPDDLLCFVAGITTMSFLYFFVMNVITRIISVTTTSFFINFFKYLLQTNLVLGIVLSAIFVVLFGIIFIISIKNADKIEKFFSKFIKKNSKKL